LAKPVVDGIERELEGRAQVVRLNVMDGVGGQLAQRYGVRGVPTMVVLDGAGETVYVKTGSPNRGEVLAAVEGVMGQ
jgi:thioredoxin-related protein